MSRRALLGALVVVAGCASDQGLEPRAAPIEPASLEAAASLAAMVPPADEAKRGWPQLDWWQRFGDPQLDALIGDALAGSPDIRLAQARVDQAAAAAQIAHAPLSPQVNASADITRARISENYIFPPPIAGSIYTTTQLALGAGYELDFWGKNRAIYEAALGRARAAQAERFAAALVLSSAVATAYVQLARAFDRLDLAKRELDERESVRKLTDDRVRAGLDSRLELKQVETSIPAARTRIAQMEEEIGLRRNQLAALLGAGPDRGLAIERPALQAASVALPARVPADLLGRRPDVVASRLRAEAAKRDIASAKAQFYPDVNLSALIGVQSVTLSKLLTAGSAIPSIGAAVSLPILDGGRLRGALAARDADYDVAVEQYNQTLAGALREVVDQLTSLRSVRQQSMDVETALASAEEAYRLAVIRYGAGLGSLLQVLSVETAVLEQRTLHADLHSRELTLSINLIRALGGGFDATVAMQ
ncbi:MAG: efflux transporter outer membrane subunit [Burkholderiales bacterium]|nr:efflux transporter outer membrane subunit [Burkholderiales bacterium]